MTDKREKDFSLNPSKNILDHFNGLEDPRQSWKVTYPLSEILLIILCSVMAGADDFVEIELWAKEKETFLKQFLPFEQGIPSHDTLNDVMNALPHNAFCICFAHWVKRLGQSDPDIIAIDGKTSRRAHGRNGRALHMVSAWASKQRLVLGQESCNTKENEIKAIPRLLQRLELTGALVTIDAMGCQTAIAKEITVKGADYLLALKGNRGDLHKEAILFFDNEKERENLDTYETVDSDHGRIEKRRSFVTHDVSWLQSHRKAPNEPIFPKLASLGMVLSEVEQDGKVVQSKRYYISSAQLPAKQFLHATRAHWGVENSLHWVMDVVFRDDLMRLRTQNGPANMATIRHCSLNILKSIPGKKSLKAKRKNAAWNEDFLRCAILNYS